MAWFSGISTLSKEYSDTLLTDPGDLADIRRPINRRSMIDLVISCCHYQSLRRIDGESERLWDTMIDSEDLDRETAEFQDIHIRINDLVFELFIILVVQ